MAAAVSAVTISTDAVVLVYARLVITLVTAGTVRLIGRETPRDVLAITGVTVGASKILAMVAGVISRHVRKDHGQPAVGGMTIVAFLISNKVTARLVACMTTTTGAGCNVGVIEGGG